MKRVALSLVAGLVSFSALVFLPSAEAQNNKAPLKSLDIGLLKQAPKILTFLDEKNHDCIGVLPFQVQKGKREASFDAAPLAQSFAGRLENAMLMSMAPDEKTAIAILRDPASYAATQKVGDWRKDQKAFDKLFATAYPLAWGDKKAKPSILLTGTIKSTGDRSVTTVEVVGFTKDSWKDGSIATFEVAKFSVKTNRTLLRDLGYSFSLPTSVVKRNVLVTRRDQVALDDVGGGGGDDDRKPTPVKPTDVSGMRFELWYGDEKQTIRALSNKDEGVTNSSFVVDDIPEGTKLTLGLTRVNGEGGRLGAIVKVNGLSIYQMDDRDSLQCLKWLFDPSDKDKLYKFHGFSTSAKGGTVPFKVLSNEESSEREKSMGSRAGWIDIDVFAAGEEKQEDEQLQLSARGGARLTQRASTLEELRTDLLKRNGVAMKKKGSKVGSRGLIVYDVDPLEGPPLSEVDALKNPVRIGGISIQYYSRKGD